ncbi:unnamed protein product [Mytilus coruscus]|uniref:Uncharacterized protein n=1 Tax=Mytilus coruscus TaxID=42192 RepID=A0A6J7ZX26_MYTCO|nr:unnamed protein product [Mytilus coruscus]
MRRIKQSTKRTRRQKSRSVGGHVICNTRSQKKKSSGGRVLCRTDAQENRSSERRVFCSTGSQQSMSSGRHVVCSTGRQRNISRGGHMFLRLSTTKSTNNGRRSTIESFHSENVTIIRCSHSLEHPRSLVVYKSRSSSLNRMEINKTDESVRECTMNSNNSYHSVKQKSSKTSDVINGEIMFSTISCSSTARTIQCSFNKTRLRSQEDIVNRRSLRNSANSISSMTRKSSSLKNIIVRRASIY